jgi:hypothetical protein
MIDCMRNGSHKTAWGLVRMRFEHYYNQFDLSIKDVARTELGNTFVVLGNTTLCTL